MIINRGYYFPARQNPSIFNIKKKLLVDLPVTKPDIINIHGRLPENSRR